MYEENPFAIIQPTDMHVDVSHVYEQPLTECQ